MVRRAREAVFMGGARVFPGGAVEDCDAGSAARRAVRWSGPGEELPWRAAALRELAEEAAITLTDSPVVTEGEGEGLYREILAAGEVLDADRLSYVSNWVTPRGPRRRFDARFYATAVGTDAGASSDQREVYEAEWVTAREALELAEAGRWQVEFPTRIHLEKVACRDTVGDALDALTPKGDVPRIEPRIARDPDGGIRIVLPGEPEYEELPG